MVNTLGRFLEKAGFNDLPYRLSVLSNTRSIENIALTSAKDEKLFAKFEEIVETSYSENNPIQAFADPAYREMIEESDNIHEDAVHFFRYENGSPEGQIIDILENSNKDRTLILGSKEYIKQMRTNNIGQVLKTLDESFTSIYR